MRSQRATTARTMAALLGGLALAVALAACTDPDGGEETTETTATTADDGGTTSASPEEPSSEASGEPSEEPTDGESDPTGDGSGDAGEQIATAAVGDCVNIAAAIAEGAGITELPPVDCSEEHDAQVFAVFDLEDADDYPGEEVVVDAVTTGCGDAFEGFVGTPPAESTLLFDGIYPSEQTWAAGDREVICIVFNADLSTTTESYEGSGL